MSGLERSIAELLAWTTAWLALICVIASAAADAHHQRGASVPQEIRYEAGRAEQAWCRQISRINHRIARGNGCVGTTPTGTICEHTRRDDRPIYGCTLGLRLQRGGVCEGRVTIRSDRRNAADPARPWRGRVRGGCAFAPAAGAVARISQRPPARLSLRTAATRTIAAMKRRCNTIFVRGGVPILIQRCEGYDVMRDPGNVAQCWHYPGPGAAGPPDPWRGFCNGYTRELHLIVRHRREGDVQHCVYRTEFDNYRTVTGRTRTRGRTGSGSCFWESDGPVAARAAEGRSRNSSGSTLSARAASTVQDGR